MAEEKEPVVTEEEVKAFQSDLDALQKKHGVTCMVALQFAPQGIVPVFKIVKAKAPSKIVTPK